MKADPERYALELERNRIKNTLRYRAMVRVTDLTPAQVLRVKRQAKVCDMCGGELDADTSRRHVEHIWPITIGGTHTRDNIRITCWLCNLKRPKDGSDVENHQLNLWMAMSDTVRLIERSRRKGCRFCGTDEIPEVRRRSGRYECLTCVPSKPRGAPRGPRGPQPERWRNEYRGKYDIDKVGKLVAAGNGYKAIASELGVSRDTARALVKRVRQISEREAAA